MLKSCVRLHLRPRSIILNLLEKGLQRSLSFIHGLDLIYKLLYTLRLIHLFISVRFPAWFNTRIMLPLLKIWKLQSRRRRLWRRHRRLKRQVLGLVGLSNLLSSTMFWCNWRIKNRRRFPTRHINKFCHSNRVLYDIHILLFLFYLLLYFVLL